MRRWICFGRSRCSRSYRVHSVVCLLFWWLSGSIFLPGQELSPHCFVSLFSLSFTSSSVSVCSHGSVSPLISSLTLLSPLSSLFSHAHDSRRLGCSIVVSFSPSSTRAPPLTWEAGDGPGHCRLFLVFFGWFLGAFCSSNSSAIWGKFLGKISVRIFVIITRDMP